jgi:hypothetical protein
MPVAVLLYTWIYLIGVVVAGRGECVISTFYPRPFSFRQRAEFTVVI